MDAQTLLIAFIVLLVLLFISPFIWLPLRALRRRRRERRLSTQISATITRIVAESGTFGSWWRVTASAMDRQTGQLLTFRSLRLSFRPSQHVGDTIMVRYNADNPAHYLMEL
jgi:hypothetical protein